MALKYAFLGQLRLKHTVLNVCEKEEIPFFLYLIQIFGIGASEYFVRCAHPDQAKTLSNAKILGNSEILAGKWHLNHHNC